jgi:regulator of protease activity HflC (stomatin/prohibitin superfamily)
MEELRTAAIIVVALGVVAYIVFRQKFRRTVVHEWNWGLHYRNGKFQGVLPPGAYRWFLPGNEIVMLDNRRQVVTIPGQEVLTQDNAGIKLSLIVEYRIEDPSAAMREVQHLTEYLYSLVQVAVREAIGKRELDEILGGRTDVADEVFETIATPMKPLGVEVIRAYLRDIMLGRELRSGYAAILAARKEGEAALERARGETAALRSLANAARMIKDNPDLVQLRVLQAMASDESGKRTFVIGVPLGTASVSDDVSDAG